MRCFHILRFCSIVIKQSYEIFKIPTVLIASTLTDLIPGRLGTRSVKRELQLIISSLLACIVYYFYTVCYQKKGEVLPIFSSAVELILKIYEKTVCLSSKLGLKIPKHI